MKKCFAFLLAGAMIFGLAACSPEKPEEDTSTEAAQESNVQAESSIQAGAGAAEIVFAKDMFPVEGFSGEVHINPYARVLLIEDIDKAAIVSLELVNTPGDIIESIKDYVAEKSGTPRDNVLVHSNHNITTPHAPEDKTQRDLFVESVMTAAKKAVDDAIASFQPAVMGVAQGECDANVNRDWELNDGWYLGFNEERYSDKTMTVIRFDSLDGKPIGIAMDYGMKPTTIDNTGMKDNIRKISADLTGFACIMMEDKYGCPAMFLMPATGDQYSKETTTFHVWDEVENKAKKIELSVEEGIALSEKYGKVIGDDAIALLEGLTCDITSAPVAVSKTSFMYGNAAGDGEVEIDVTSMAFGDDIAFVGLKAELNAITGSQIMEQSPYPYTLLMGFLDGDQKYMPDEEAYDLQTWEFKRTGFARGCAEEFVKVSVKLLEDLKAGIVHTADEGKEDSDNVGKTYETVQIGELTWLVLEDRDGKQFVVSQDIVGQKAFNSAGGESTWETSEIRIFLNDEFFDQTFSDDEKARIEETNVVTGANSKYGITGGNDTTDKIFILSIEEAEQYLVGSDYIIAKNTDGQPAWWHLRTMGEAKDVQACVTVEGAVDYHGPHGGVTNEEGGIRPAMWIKKY
ncbi:MAG: DUF6273 domain-containing protein [Lachnospiraceae bacterium]|jgi:neutral ceramidase